MNATVSLNDGRQTTPASHSRRIDWRTALLLIALLLAGFAVRIYHPVSRSDNWMNRSYDFDLALSEHDWASTYQQYHPGVTTMAITSATLRVYQKIINTHTFPFTVLQALFDWATSPYTVRYGREVTVGVFGLAAVMTLMIGLSALILIRLGNKAVGLVAAGLMAFSPYYLAQSRVFHVDALLSTFMMLSALLILLYLRNGRWLHLVLSGLVAGLALLTKTPAVFLAPYTGLVLGVGLLGKLREGWADHGADRVRWLAAETGRRLVLPLVIWLVVAVLPFALWPAMWVEPLTILDLMYGSISHHLLKTHPSVRFFAGQLYAPGAPPNRLFYLVVLALDTSFVTLTLTLVAILIYALPRLRVKNRPGWQNGRPLPEQTFYLIAAYVFFFVLQMTIGDKQDQRYILPVFPMLNIIAAVGVVGLAGLLRERLGERGQRLMPVAIPIAAIGLQALAGAPYIPDYGAHFNHLFGGNLGAIRMLEIADQTEGIEDVAAYLHQHADLSSDMVGTTDRNRVSLQQYYNINQIVPTELEADYYLFSQIYQQRDLSPEQWLPTWERMQSITPALIVQFDGVEYLRLYAATSPPDSTTVVNHDGRWLIFMAWAWALLLVDLLIRVMRPVSDDAGEKPARAVPLAEGSR